METLEDRVVPDGTPGATFDPTENVPPPAPPPDAVPVEWQGQTWLAAPGRWLIEMDGLTGTPAEQAVVVEATVSALGLNVHVEQYLGLAGQFRLSGPAELDAQVLADALSAVPGVRSLEPDFVEAAGQVIPNDTEFARLWGMHNTGNNPGVGVGVVDADIDAPEAWDLTGPNRGSTQIITAIVDSGVDYTHPDLYLNIWLNQTEIPASVRPTLIDTDADGLITFWDLNAPANAGRVADNNVNGRIDAGDVLRPTALGGWMDNIDGNAPGTANTFVDDLIGWDFFNNENNPDDEVVNVWHGTHVAGTIAGIGNNGIGVTGVTWRNQIMVLRGLGPNNTGPYSALLGGLNYAVANGAKLSNHSWGGTAPSAPLESAVVNARNNGHLMVVAAGNNGWNNDTIGTPSIPASYPYDNIISVANLTNTNARNGSSNYGVVSVDLGAPGTNVFSTFHSVRANSYGYLSGTSMATPHVAGTAALMLSINPTASYTQIRNAILQTTDPVAALATNGTTPVATGGRLNAASAVAAVGFAVTSTTPAAGAVVTAPPTEFVVNFSRPYDPVSVQPSDLTVNGIAATGITFTDLDTLTFTFDTSPVTAEGVQTIAVAAGAISAANNGGAVSAFTSTFRYDAVPLVVQAVSPPSNTIVAAPFTFIDVTFNEPVAPGSVQASDLTLSRGTVAGAEVLAGTDGRVVRFSLAGLTASGPVTAVLGAGLVADAFGNPGPAAPFVAQYGINTLATVFPVPLTALPPLGSLAYTGSTTGVIAAPGELDPFALAVDGGQTVTVVVTPAGAAGGFGEAGGEVSSLRPTIQLRNPAGVVVATAESPAAGVPAVLQVGPAAATGIYTITVGSLAGSDAYSVLVYLNAAVESEAVGGPTNGTRPTAQDLNPAFLDLLPGSPAQRAAVRGQLTSAASNNLITNGNFETGDFSGWTVTPATGPNSWRINNGTLDPASPATPLAPIAGSFDAVTDPTGATNRVISQSFVVPAGITTATLSWADRIQNFAGQFVDPGQEFRVLLTDSIGNVLQTAFSTNVGDPPTQIGPNSRSFDVTALLQSRAGQTLQLRFEQQDSLNFFNVTIDNIVLATNQPVQPPTVPSGTNLVTNGGFESGNLSGWTVTPLIGVNGWQINNGTLDPVSPANPLAPIAGNFDTFTDSTGPGTRVISQSFVVPTGITAATLSWADRIQNFANEFQDPNQEFRVILADAAGVPLQTVFSTNAGDPPTQIGPNSRSFDVTALLQSRAGQTLQLRFEQQDSLFFFNVTLDSIALTVATTPPAPPPPVTPPDDFYSLALTAGQSVDLVLALSNFAPVTSFAPTRTDFPVAPTRYPIAVGYRDLNGDGKLDMVSATNDRNTNANGAIGVRLGNGDGTFGALTEYSTLGGVFTRFLDFGDVNGDGRVDVIATNDGAPFVSLFLGNGDGTFQTVRNTQAPISGLGLTVADVNGDGRADAVVPHFSGIVSVLLGQVNGTLGAPTTFLANAGGTFGTDVGDLNGDGRLDIVTANFNTGNMSVLLQQPNGTFGPATVLSMAASPWDVELADFNGDGRLDAVTANQGAGNIAVRLGNGNGTFGNPTFFSTGGNGPRTVAVGDVNNDGKLDVVVPNIGSRTIGVLPGNGNGTFGAALTYATGIDPNAATVADVNGDGLLDISSADAAGGAITVRLNTTPQVQLELQDAAGNVVATAVRGATNFDRGLTFTPTASGTYYARVFGTAPTATYTLVATRGAAFDAEPNETAPTAQPLSGAGALGAIGSTLATGTITFSELPLNTSINGATINGVTFGFTIGGQQNTEARISTSGPGTTRFTTPPQVIGPITAAAPAALTMTFATPVTVFGFGVATNATTTVPNGATVRLFDAANVLIATTPLTFTPQQGFSIFAEAQFNHTGAAVKRAELMFSGVGASSFAFDNLTFQAGGDQDWYALPLAAGERVRLTTATPAGGPGEFVNVLNPRIELFDAAGNPVAAGTPLLDNRNETILFTAPAAGTYRVRVTGENSTVGEYFLGVNRSPVAANDLATTNEDTPVDIPVLANDADDAPFGPGAVTVVAGPANGTVSVSAAGVVTYTPNANFSGTDSFTYTATDTGGDVSNVASVNITVNAVADAPTLTVTPTASGNENAPIPLDISPALVDTDGSEVLSITIAGVPTGGVLSAGIDSGGGSWALTPAQLAGLTILLPDNLPGDVPFTLTVTATATEQSNGSADSTAATIDVTVQNVAPTATLDVPAGGVEGSPVNVALTGATDVSPVDQAAGFEYAFDLGSGYGAFGASNTASFTPTDNGTYTVKAMVRDKDGGVTEYTATVEIDNVDPVITAANNSAPTIGAAVEGQTVTVSATFTDAGTADTHTATIDWGDGVVTSGAVAQGAGFGTVTGGHSYAAGGVYTITVTLQDDDGGATTATTRAYVSGVGLRNGVLTIVGTAGANDVHLNQQGNGELKFQADFLPGGQRNFALADVRMVVALLGAGNDVFSAAGNVTLPMVVDGGTGNDRLTGGRGPNILIGGTGADELTGGKAQDILIGGTTAFDGDPFALAALLAEWSDPTKSLATRVANLTDGTGSPTRANGNYFLTNATVFEDSSADRLDGKQNTDWYFADPSRDDFELEGDDLFGEQ